MEAEMVPEKSNVFPRKLNVDLPRAEKAEGVYIVDDRGRKYLDASGGAVVANLGQGREEIARAVYDQLMSFYYAHPTMFSSSSVETLASKLAMHSAGDLGRFYFLSSGSEAVEASIKMARQAQLALGKPQKHRLIARWKSYHGLTLGALSAMGRTSFRVPYAPMLPEVEHIAPPYCYRCFYELEYPGCGLRCARALEDAILSVGPEIVSAFLGETVSGATIAGVVPPPGYWSLIRSICDRYGVLLILDEVMCGMGRTGTWFAYQDFDVKPDMVTLGKGLSGGSLPLSAVGVKAELYDAVAASGGFVHGGTFSHHPVTAAAGVAAVDILEREELVERAASMGKILGRLLSERLGQNRHVGDIRGKGLLWGVEIVADRDSKRPYPRSEKTVERLWRGLFERGVIVYSSIGLAGYDGDALIVSPPFVIKERELVEIVEKLGSVIESVLG
jgi:adenosylmethionine-8-amino-7-oxononanoate aminotransferase